MLHRALILIALLTAIATTAFSGARFTAQSLNRSNVLSADATSNYLHAYSQPTNPGGLTTYAIRKGSTPQAPAATGTDDALTVNLGGYSNVGNTNLKRVFTLTTPAALPAGVSSITATISVVADATTGSQPITDYNIATTSDSSPAKSVTLTAGQTRHVDLTTATKNLTANTQYVPSLVVDVTYTGYSGGFLSYVVPVKIYDGAGAGPN